jgi:hypothetical protein
MKEKSKNVIIIMLAILLVISCYLNIRQYVTIKGYEDGVNDIRIEGQVN